MEKSLLVKKISRHLRAHDNVPSQLWNKLHPRKGRNRTIGTFTPHFADTDTMKYHALTNENGVNI